MFGGLELNIKNNCNTTIDYKKQTYKDNRDNRLW